MYVGQAKSVFTGKSWNLSTSSSAGSFCCEKTKAAPTADVEVLDVETNAKPAADASKPAPAKKQKVQAAERSVVATDGACCSYGIHVLFVDYVMLALVAAEDQSAVCAEVEASVLVCRAIAGLVGRQKRCVCFCR